MKRGDIDFQCADNIVDVKWYDNRGVTLVRTCLEGCNQISSVSHRVKDKSAKIPVPCPAIVKEYNNSIDGVDLLDQRTAAYKLDRKLSSWRYYVRLFFDLMDIAVVNSHAVYKALYTKGMELLDFKIVIAKSLIGAYDSRFRNTSITHTSLREVLPASVPLHLPVIQTTRSKCRYCYNAGIENKTYMQCKGPYIYDVHMEGGWESLEICHVFAESIVFRQ